MLVLAWRNVRRRTHHAHASCCQVRRAYAYARSPRLQPVADGTPTRRDAPEADVPHKEVSPISNLQTRCRREMRVGTATRTRMRMIIALHSRPALPRR